MKFYHPERMPTGFVFDVEWHRRKVPVSVSNQAIAAHARSQGIDLANLAGGEAEYLDAYQADFAVMFGEAAFPREVVSSARILPSDDEGGVEVVIA